MLRRSELALIYIMWIIATPIPERGLTSFLLPHITSVIYYATPENNWDSLFPFIPGWMIPHHDFEQIKYFYEGAPQGQGICAADLVVGAVAAAADLVAAVHPRA